MGSYPGNEEHPDKDLVINIYQKVQVHVVIWYQRRKRSRSKLINRLNYGAHVANVGDAKSLIIHPASTTHQQLDDEGLNAAGVREDLIRLSVGIENVEDLLEDLKQAIEKATGMFTLSKC